MNIYLFLRNRSYAFAALPFLAGNNALVDTTPALEESSKFFLLQLLKGA